MNDSYKKYPITKNINGSYTITAIINGQELPYNVCEYDEDSKFNFAEVKKYWDSLADNDERKMAEEDVVAPELTAEEKKSIELAKLNAQYKIDKTELSLQYFDAAMNDDANAIKEIKQKFATLNAKYNAQMKSISSK